MNDDDMSAQPSICVFCGSRTGVDPRYEEAARSLGATLGKQGIGLIYGGGRVGLMGAVADATLNAGGKVIGVIPEPLALREIAHEGLTELHVVSGMHERKAMMADLADAFVTLPGGIGTFEEFFEILTWGVLGLHRKPIGLLDVAGYFGPLRTLLDQAVRAGFVRRGELDHLIPNDDPRALLEKLLTYTPPTKTRRLDPDQIESFPSI